MLDRQFHFETRHGVQGGLKVGSALLEEISPLTSEAILSCAIKIRSVFIDDRDDFARVSGIYNVEDGGKDLLGLHFEDVFVRLRAGDALLLGRRRPKTKKNPEKDVDGSSSSSWHLRFLGKVSEISRGARFQSGRKVVQKRRETCSDRGKADTMSGYYVVDVALLMSKISVAAEC